MTKIHKLLLKRVEQNEPEKLEKVKLLVELREKMIKRHDEELIENESALMDVLFSKHE